MADRNWRGHPAGSPCVWCRRPMHRDANRRDGLFATRDHVMPKSQNTGEAWSRQNLVWACKACNELKANISPFEWERIMFRFPNWWSWWKPKGAPRLSVVILDEMWRKMMEGDQGETGS